MKFIQGQNRTQINLFPVSLDQTINADNEVRITELFVDSLSIKDYGFRTDFIDNGRPEYHPCDLLKLFIHGVPSTSLDHNPLHGSEYADCCERNHIKTVEKEHHIYCLQSPENREYSDHECAEGVSEDTFIHVNVPV